MRVRKTDNFEDLATADAFANNLPDEAAAVVMSEYNGSASVRYWTNAVPPKHCYESTAGQRA